MSQNKRSKIPVRPHTVSGVKTDVNPIPCTTTEQNKHEIEVQYASDREIESLTNINDAFATGDFCPEINIPPENNQISVEDPPAEKKIPLFKQNYMNCALLGAQKPSVPSKKYTPNYQKEVNQSNKKKRISVPDEIKYYGIDEPFPECGLAEQITKDLEKQMKELKMDENLDKIKCFNTLTDSKKLQELEDRITKLEEKLELFIEMLYESKIIKRADLKIKLEEYNLEKLNSTLKIHEKCDDEHDKNVKNDVVDVDSDPNVFQEIFYETQQKYLNMTTFKLSDESLKFNKIPGGCERKIYSKHFVEK